MSGLSTDISNGIGNVRNTFSSWDACMSKSYCKYPVIVGIVIGSIILLSILWCIASCLCCGATLCGSCVRCLTCFGCCGACGKRGGGGGNTRHKDDYTKMPPTPYNGYQQQNTPMTYQPPSAAPQVAQFDAPSGRIHADSLPAMPTWSNARSVRVEDHNEPPHSRRGDVEMGTIPVQQSQARMRGGYNQVPNEPVSPMSPPDSYGNFEGQGQPYSSDLGTQRLGSHGTAYHQPNDYQQRGYQQQVDPEELSLYHQHTGYQQQTGHEEQTRYSDFIPSPLSPAPTYRTNPSIAPTVPTYRTNASRVPSHSDRFARRALSPASEYQNPQPYSSNREQMWSSSPSNHNQHTYERSPSAPLDQQDTSYDHQQKDTSGVRPPSLLQIGRKPVAGTQREV